MSSKEPVFDVIMLASSGHEHSKLAQILLKHQFSIGEVKGYIWLLSHSNHCSVTLPGVACRQMTKQWHAGTCAILRDWHCHCWPGNELELDVSLRALGSAT